MIFRAARSGHRRSRSSRRGPTRCSAPPSSCWRRSTRWSPTSSAAPTARPRCWRTCAARAGTSVADRMDAGKVKTGVFTGRHVDQPGQRRADPDLGRRLRAGRLRHRRRDGRAGARRARFRVRADVRPADPPGRRADRRRPRHRDRGRTRSTRPTSTWSTRASSTACPPTSAMERIVDWLRAARPRQAHDRLPAARLAGVAAALLGRADPGHQLRARAAWSACPRPTCPCCCPT